MKFIIEIFFTRNTSMSICFMFYSFESYYITIISFNRFLLEISEGFFISKNQANNTIKTIKINKTKNKLNKSLPRIKNMI